MTECQCYFRCELFFLFFSRSYCGYCHHNVIYLSVRLSIFLSVMKCIVLNDTAYIQQKYMNIWIGHAPWEHDFTTFNSLHRPCPLKLPTPKFSNFTYLLYLAFLITWPLCLSLRTWESIVIEVIVNQCVVLVRSAVSATAWLLVLICHNLHNYSRQTFSVLFNHCQPVILPDL